MTVRPVVYWTTTILTALSFMSGGFANVLRVEDTVQGVVALGYPVYFVSIIGGWKLLAGLAILAPRFPLLKEWAYAGIAFELTGATLSHVAMGSAAVKAIVPLVILATAVASWALRPPSRKLKASARHSPSPLIVAHEYAAVRP